MDDNTKQLDEIENRLIRVESRIVQIMNHLGVAPKGAMPIKVKQQLRELQNDQQDA